MGFDEGWLNSKRSTVEELPEYTFWPDGRAKLITGIYVAIFVLFFVGISTLGTQAIIIGGVPSLIWITVIANVASLLVLYFVIYIPEARRVEKDEVAQ